MPNRNLFSRVVSLTGLPYGEKLHTMLDNFHQTDAKSVKSGRNVVAGYARSWGLQFCNLGLSIIEDPLFQESWKLASERTLVSQSKFLNIFLIMKYGMKDLSGDFIELGCYKCGMAIFIASVAKGLGMKGTVYALDTFEGMPPSDNLLDIHFAGNFADVSYQETLNTISTLNLPNLVLVKGLFHDTLPEIMRKTPNVALAHIDCDIYSSVTYSIAALRRCMNQPGGYMIFDDPISSSCLGALEAVEEMIQEHGMRAEQSWPHLVYRLPKLIVDEKLLLSNTIFNQ